MCFFYLLDILQIGSGGVRSEEVDSPGLIKRDHLATAGVALEDSEKAFAQKKLTRKR